MCILDPILSYIKMNVFVVAAPKRLHVSEGVRAIMLHLFWSFLILTFRFEE